LLILKEAKRAIRPKRAKEEIAPLLKIKSDIDRFALCKKIDVERFALFHFGERATVRNSLFRSLQKEGP